MVITTPYFTNRQRWLLIGLILLAFSLRLYRLNVQSIWFDEALSALFASQPLEVGIQSMLQEGLHHSPLYYILIRPFTYGSFSEFGLRFLSVVFGVLTIPMLAQLGRMIAGAQVGLLVTGLLLCNPFHVWYSQEGRMYTLLIGCAVGAMLFFSRNFKHPSYKNWLGLALCIAVSINSHHFAFFIPLIQFIFIVITLKRNYHLLRPWVATQFLAALSLIPWLMIVLDWGEFYLSSASVRPPSAYDLFQTFWNFSIGYTVQFTPFVAGALGLFLFLLILGVKSSYQSNEGLLLILWGVVPPLVTFLVSFRLPTYLDRYISLSLPPFLLLIAIGLNTIRTPLRQLGTFALVLSLMLINLYRVYYDTTVYERADWRALGDYLAENVGPGDEIVIWYQQYLIPLHFYYQGPVAPKPVISFKVVDLSVLSDDQTGSQKLWVILGHPNDSAHLVGHCQAFNIEALSSLVAANQWLVENQPRRNKVVEFSCIRLEVYQ